MSFHRLVLARRSISLQVRLFSEMAAVGYRIPRACFVLS